MGMTANEIVTVEHLSAVTNQLLAEIKSLKNIAVQASDRLLTIDEATEIIGYSRKTITTWIKEGKKNHLGRVVYLDYFEFAPGQYRIPLNKLLAFGKVGQE
ncbi:MerR family transcriptional regulator [Pontibacter beigongshangensis]|uniref:helix-turn-helix domain-containing protein n=1 Tax=Pontibacter beigongshangensis TaxID=2574733 RepID=UPI00164F1437|nr:helix-turn-helix domain-containing protein [Pontibacter beigongshangensis]